MLIQTVAPLKKYVSMFEIKTNVSLKSILRWKNYAKPYQAWLFLKKNDSLSQESIVLLFDDTGCQDQTYLGKPFYLFYVGLEIKQQSFYSNKSWVSWDDLRLLFYDINFASFHLQ